MEQSSGRGSELAGSTRSAPVSAAAGATLALLVLLAGIVVCRLAVLTSDWAWDTGAWMFISRRILEGDLPYVHVWDNKLPPVFWMGVLYLETGVPRVAMFVTEVALTSLSALMLAGILRAVGMASRWALVLGALFVCASMPAWEYPHRLETYALAPLSVGLWLVVRATRDGELARARTFLLAGFLVAVAVTFRAQHVGDALLIGAWILLLGGQGHAARRLAAYVGGGALYTALFLGAVTWRGYLSEMFRDAVLGGASYASGEEAAVSHRLGSMVWQLRTNVDQMPLVWLGLGVGLALGLAAWWRLAARERGLLALALGLFVVQFAFTFVAGHQIIHYHYPLGWTAALLLGLALAVVGLRSGNAVASASWLAPAVVVALFVSTALPNQDVATGVQQVVKRVTEGPLEGESASLERLLRERVPPDAPLYILDEYAMSGALARLPNPPAQPRIILAMQARYMDPAEAPEDTSPYGLTTMSWGRMIRDELEADPPAWLVRKVGMDDELTPWVRSHYDEVADNGEYVVLALRER
jgi:hypothetical protein